MRIMGIDYGDKRIGIALSDMLGIMASGFETINVKEQGLKEVIARIKEIVEEHNVNMIVVGMPRNMNGTSGERCEKTKCFINNLAKALPSVKIKEWDERLTTVSAQKTLAEIGLNRKKRKKIIDQVAAEFILQTYLDSIR